MALRDAINAGDLIGPRMPVSGPPLRITGGHCDNSLLPFEFHHSAEGVADGPEAVMHRVREVIKYGADVVQVLTDAGPIRLEVEFTLADNAAVIYQQMQKQ